MQFWSSLKQRSNQIKFSFIQNLMPPCNMHHTITSHRHTRCDWWDQRAVILWMLEPEERDAVASQRGGQEVAAREPRACRDRVHTRLCAALHRQAGVPRVLQALAGGGHRCARQRGLPQAVGATCKCIPLWWTRGQHKVGTLRSQNTSWEDPTQVLQWCCDHQNPHH